MQSITATCARQSIAPERCPGGTTRRWLGSSPQGSKNHCDFWPYIRDHNRNCREIATLGALKSREFSTPMDFASKTYAFQRGGRYERGARGVAATVASFLNRCSCWLAILRVKERSRHISSRSSRHPLRSPPPSQLPTREQ